jgi:two-component system, sensor histidine kinase
MNFFLGRPYPKWGIATWPVLLIILISSSFISYYLRNFTNSYLLYLPTSIAIVMTYWFGPWVLLLDFVSSIFTLVLWKAPGGWWWFFLQATREPLVVFTFWFFCKNIINNSKGFSDRLSFVRFAVLGIMLPDTINSFYTYHYSFVNGDLERVFLLWLSDFITIFLITIPLLHFFHPEQYGKIFKLKRNDSIQAHLNKDELIGVKELVAMTILFVALNVFIDFEKYWYLYGIVATMVAARNGFETVVLANLIIFVLNYIPPLFGLANLLHSPIVSSHLLSVHIGMGTMFFTSTLIGRVITDLRKTETALTEQKGQIEKTNQQLTLANREMDRFVYSVSHDISAPLKSIKGLIGLVRLEKEDETFPYISQIETSVQKLENFVSEVLDHSRTTRKEVQLEEIDLRHLINDITDNLKYLERFDEIKFTFELNALSLYTDKFLIKTVLSNLLSNAIKYQKRRTEQPLQIKIKSWHQDSQSYITIIDNGEGIAAPYKDKIFEMFYRGTTNSTGSGLGLFIAKEAAEKMQGKIEFISEHGVGSEFTINIPFPPDGFNKQNEHLMSQSYTGTK